MSVKTAAQSFEHKPISNNLTPKPYGSSGGSSKKPKTLEKPSFLTNNNNNTSIDRESLPTIETKKPVIQTNELSSFKFKNNKTTNNNKDTSSIQNGITNTTTSTNTNSTTKKKPPSVSKKPAPTDEELTVRHVEEKSADQLKNEKELMKLPSGSVRNSKMMFEKHDVDAVRRRTSTGASSKKIRAGSAISNSSTDSSTSSGTTSSCDIQTTNASPKMSTFNAGSKQQQQQNQMKKPASLPRPLLENNINNTFGSYQQQQQQQNNTNKNKSRKLSSTPATPTITTPTISAPEITNIKIDYDQLEQDYDDVKTPLTPTRPAPIAVAAPVAPPVIPTKPIQPIVTKPDVTADDIYDDVQQHTFPPVTHADDIYDDVSSPDPTKPTSKNDQIPTHPTSNIVRPNSINPRPNTAHLPPPPPSEQCIYDDVQGASAEVVPHFTPAPHPIAGGMIGMNSNVVTGEELYDDVGAAGTTPVQDIYDDVQTSPGVPPSSVPQHIQSRPPPATPLASAKPNSSTSSFAPLKTEKTFPLLPSEKFKMPYGLDQWLKDMLTANTARLKNLNKTTSSDVPSIPPRSITPIEIEGEDDDGIYHMADTPLSPATTSTPSTTKPVIENEKEKKRKEKEKKKAEKEKEKERNRKNKELKSFGLSLDTIDPRRRGIYVCSTDFSANKKLLVSYKSGDELTVIEVAKQYRQPGKMVVQNNRDGKVGYVLKSSFNVPEDEDDDHDEPDNNQLSPEPAKDRAPSLIPFEDEEEEEIYADCDAPTPTVVPAPPVPNTPRPQFAPPVTTDGLIEEQLYEPI